MKQIAIVLFLGGCSFIGGGFAVLICPRIVGSATADQAALPPPASDIFRISDRFENVARRMAAAVVYVEASKTKSAQPGKNGPVEESGSGVLIQIDGQPTPLVLTNNHVISQASPEQITVNLADGRMFRPNRLWADPETDIAVLRLEGGVGLPTAPLGDSDQARVGQWVLAFGSPFGLNQSVTHGIISARERGQVSLGTTIRIKDFLQTDAAINPGSSGGPLVNLQGEVIGINTAIASHSGGNSGVAFSIPANLVKRIVGQLLERGTISRGYLGMQMMSGFEPADAWKLGLDRVRGAWVESVFPGTPAESAGLRPQDVILQVDELPVKNENQFINHISTLTAGQKIRLQVWRERKLINLEAVVGDWSKDQARFKSGSNDE